MLKFFNKGNMQKQNTSLIIGEGKIKVNKYLFSFKSELMKLFSTNQN